MLANEFGGILYFPLQRNALRVAGTHVGFVQYCKLFGSYAGSVLIRKRNRKGMRHVLK